MKNIALELDDDEYEDLEAAAQIAERDIDDFILEEILSLARIINLHGNLSAVKLDRHRQSRNRALLDAVRQAGEGDTAIQDWARANPDLDTKE